jgi:hypothetical protein
MKSTSLAVILVFLLAGTAAAATIDFRDASFSGAHNQASFTAPVDGGYSVALTALPTSARLYWDSTDGFGVRSVFGTESDEIAGFERLKIDFSVPVYLSSVLLTDLFKENSYLERGAYQLNGTGNWIWFSADPSQTPSTSNGELNLLLDPTFLVSSILFKAPGWLPLLGQNHEFSVAALEASPVPIPAAAWLLGSGLVGMVALRRRSRMN